jgi:ABC-type phosphate/phosphonate transport system substrate-binding protein
MAELTRREALATALTLPLLPAVASAEKPAAAANALAVLVMDPLAAPLSCSCVKGYAQRDYDKLGKHLEEKLGRPVAVHYAASLAGALKKSEGKADLVIAKDSVVLADAPASKLAVTRLARLTDKDGKTTQTGLVCVAAADAAVTPANLKGYTIYFGNPSAEEKHGAAVKLLKELGVEVPAKPETIPTCSDAALKVVEEAKAGQKIATVISSYAQPLLEGCGTIKKGELRVIAETDPVPFIAAFATGSLAAGEQTSVKAALLAVGAVKELLTALETKAGFVEPEPAKKK